MVFRLGVGSSLTFPRGNEKRKEKLYMRIGCGKLKDFMAAKRRGLVYGIQCRRLRKYVTAQGRQTSASDNDYYPALCYAASKEPSYFKDFRRNIVYNRILENVSKEDGQRCLDVIAKNKVKFTDADWDDFLKNDSIGTPKTFSYHINGRTLSASPTTVRYAKVLQDILVLFDTGKIRSVAEIGVGYGGQCRIMTSYLKTLEHYRLFDLPEVLALTERYLGHFDAGPAEFVDGTKVDTDTASDLIISNFAFTELIPEVQDIYLKHVILRARAGYITYNALGHNLYRSYSPEQLLEKIPGSSIIPEDPLTCPGNCIIIWPSL